MPKYFLYHLILAMVVAFCHKPASAKDSYFKGFYHGENVFIRNPYLEGEKQFCISAVYLNGQKVVDSPKLSAFEIQLEGLELNSRIVIRIIHGAACTPQLINAEVIQEDLIFSWQRIYVNEDGIIWITSTEDKYGYYEVERLKGERWIVEDTANAKGGLFVNQYAMPLPHEQGNNEYRVVYVTSDGERDVSDPFNFISEKREVDFSIDPDSYTIEFSEEVTYQVQNEARRPLLRGKAHSFSIGKLPKGSYYLIFNGKEELFER